MLLYDDLVTFRDKLIEEGSQVISRYLDYAIEVLTPKVKPTPTPTPTPDPTPDPPEPPEPPEPTIRDLQLEDIASSVTTPNVGTVMTFKNTAYPSTITYNFNANNLTTETSVFRVYDENNTLLGSKTWSGSFTNVDTSAFTINLNATKGTKTLRTDLTGMHFFADFTLVFVNIKGTIEDY